MVKLSLQYGMHERTAFAFCTFAMAVSAVFNDISEGYRLGKYAQACTTKKNMPEVHLHLYGCINIWKEPLQATLPELLKANKVGEEVR